MVITKTHVTLYDGEYSIYDFNNQLVAGNFLKKVFQINDKLIIPDTYITVVDRTKMTTRKTKNELLDQQLNYNAEDYLYFLNENHNIVKLNLETMEETVLDGKYKSIMTTYNSKYDIVAVDENDNIMMHDDQWHEYPLKLPFDELKYYIGSRHNGPGIVASNGMIYRIGKPSIRLYANFVYYDNVIIICKNGFSSIQFTF